MSYRREFLTNKFINIFSGEVVGINIEKGIFNYTIELCRNKKIKLSWNEPKFVKLYSTIARKVVANLTYTPNAKKVIENINDGIFSPENIAKMTHQELYPEFWKEQKDKVMSKLPTKEEQEHDGFFKCGKCKTKKTTYTQAQTRSADEPMTTFVTCLNCNHRWKF